MPDGAILIEREIRHFHFFCGLGGGAKGFNAGAARAGNLVARFRCIGDVDSDPAAIRDFARLAGVPGTLIDLFDREQYTAFHGREPQRGWRPAGVDDIRRAAGGERPHIIPQMIRSSDGGVGAVYAEVEKLTRMGPNAQLGYTLINPRPESVNKEVLELCDTLFLHRQRGRRSLENLGKWLDVADAQGARAIRDSLSTLRQGECWVWASGSDAPARIQVPEKRTRHPNPRERQGETSGPKSAAAADVSTFVSHMESTLATLVAEEKANDPKNLRARIAELERELKAKPAADPAAVDQAWTEGYAQGEAETTAKHAERIQEMQAAIDAALGYLAPFIKREGEEVPVIDVRRPVPPPTIEQRPARPPRAPPQVRAAPPPRADGAPPLQVTGTWQRILDALAWLDVAGLLPASKVQLAFISGYSSSSSGFANYLGAMRSAGLIEYPASGKVDLTAEGAQQSHPPERALDTATLHAALREKLGTAKWSVLAAAIDAYPEAVDREAIAAASGYSPSSSGFANYLGELRSLGLIDYPGRGMVRAEDILFIGGVR